MEKIFAGKNFVSGMESILPAKNDTPYKRIFAVGDVHGDFSKLMTLWKKLSVTDEDLVVFAGDYIDRGDEIYEVLKWLLAQSSQKNIVFLRGNHEQMMLDTLDGVLDKLTWFFNGGAMTIAALRKMKFEDETYIDKVLDLVESFPLYHAMTIGGRQYVFVHAGIEENIPLEEQEERFLLWSREEFFDRYEGDAVVIGGHSPVQLFPDWGVEENPRPVKLPDKNILMIDTGSHFGKISAVNILTGEYFNSDDD